MQIRKKADIQEVMAAFCSFALWDSVGHKHYLILEDRNRSGQWTLMFYKQDNLFSIHGQGIDYKDEAETFLHENENVSTFLWNNRSAYNAAVKKYIQNKIPRAI